jgi:hypothetical protein
MGCNELIHVWTDVTKGLEFLAEYPNYRGRSVCDCRLARAFVDNLIIIHDFQGDAFGIELTR